METKKSKTEKARRNSRVTGEQKQYLIDFMAHNPAFANKSLSNTFTRKEYDVMLKMMTNHLNQIGPWKTEDKWLRTWIDMKTKARQAGVALSTRYKKMCRGPNNIPLSNLNKEKVIQISGSKEVVDNNKYTEYGTLFCECINFDDETTNKKRIEERNHSYPLHQSDDTIDKSSDVEDDPETVIVMHDNEDYYDEVEVLLDTDKSQNSSHRSPVLHETNTKKMEFEKKRKKPNKLTAEMNEFVQPGRSNTSSQLFPAINIEPKRTEMELGEKVECNGVADAGPTLFQESSIFNKKIKKSEMISYCDLDRRLEEENKRQTVAIESIATHLGTLVEYQKSFLEALNKIAAGINSNT